MFAEKVFKNKCIKMKRILGKLNTKYPLNSVDDIMLLDIIPARSEAEWPSSREGPCPEDMI